MPVVQTTIAVVFHENAAGKQWFWLLKILAQVDS